MDFEKQRKFNEKSRACTTNDRGTNGHPQAKTNKNKKQKNCDPNAT